MWVLEYLIWKCNTFILGDSIGYNLFLIVVGEVVCIVI